MKKYKYITSILLLIITSSCGVFVNSIDNKDFETINYKGKDVSIIFTHNVNGETHPCGCRHFPLGGLPQVAGLLHRERSNKHVIYIDTGDLLYPSSVVPKSLLKSLNFTAKNLVQAMNDLKLDYFVPGDQDFAGGLSLLQNIAKNSNFKFLISNLRNEKTIKHKKWALINNGPNKIFIVGVVNPNTLPTQYQELFLNPIYSLKKTMIELKKNGFNPKNNFHRLIILSHSGMDYDEKMAKEYPRTDWIIGAHSQSFTKDSFDIKNTKLVQVLSRNHYLGNISIKHNVSRKQDKYKLLEIRDSLAGLLKPNKYINFINKHKIDLQKIQDTEQSSMDSEKFLTATSIPTASSCIECHTKQGEFWMGTSHSLAYSTLVKAKEEKRQQCIGCHSVGFKKGNGFFKTSNILNFDNQDDLTKKQIQNLKNKYHRSIKKIMKDVISVRRLNKKQIHSKSKKIYQLNEKLKIKTNFSNVQCLNCHSNSVNHPFENKKMKRSSAKTFSKIRSRCLSCHTKDQSIDWYKKDNSGLPSELNELQFFENYKKVACPKIDQ